KARRVTLQQLIDSGILRPPLRIEHEFEGVTLRATITTDGNIRFNGRVYGALRSNGTPLSTAAGVALATVRDPPPGRRLVPADGWLFWRFRSEDGRLLAIDVLRRRYRDRHGG